MIIAGRFVVSNQTKFELEAQRHLSSVLYSCFISLLFVVPPLACRLVCKHAQNLSNPARFMSHLRSNGERNFFKDRVCTCYD